MKILDILDNGKIVRREFICETKEDVCEAIKNSFLAGDILILKNGLDFFEVMEGCKADLHLEGGNE